MTVEVVEYRNSWPQDFEHEQRLIEKVISPLSPAISHIGSTSVTGLSAKPIIDILVEVDDLNALDACNYSLKEIGYRARGENGIPERRYFEKGEDFRTHQIHAFKRNSQNAIRHLAFRDYLRSHPLIAKQYAELKKEVAESCNNNIALYCDGKNNFIKYHEMLALKWYTQSILTK